MTNTCIRGHDLNGPEVYHYAGKRICKLCRRERQKAAATPTPRKSETPGMTAKEKQAFYARRRYWRDKGKPIPEEKGKRFKPGSECMACHLPIATREDKHSNYATHRWCRPGDAFRDGEACKICQQPVAIADKHCKEKAHDACVKKRSEENKKLSQEERNARRPRPKPKQFQKLQRMTRAEKKAVEVLPVLDTQDEKAKYEALLERARQNRITLTIGRFEWDRECLLEGRG